MKKSLLLLVLTLLSFRAWCYSGDDIVTIAIEQPDGRKVDVTFKYDGWRYSLYPLTFENYYYDGELLYGYYRFWGYAGNRGGLNPIKMDGFSIGDGSNCAIDPQFEGSLTIPDSIVVKGEKYPILDINDKAFRNCKGLISFSATTLGIGRSAFEKCQSLKSVKVAGIRSIYNNEEKMWVDGNYYTYYYSTSPTEIGSSAFYGCVELEEFCSDGPFFEIGIRAFCDCKKLSDIPALFINWRDRDDKPISSIIKEGAFSGCENLTSIHIPATVTSIGEKAFSYCGSVKESNSTTGKAHGRRYAAMCRWSFLDGRTFRQCRRSAVEML